MPTRRVLTQPRVDYVLLAEFDIDQGSTLKHQYPAPTGTDEQYVHTLHSRASRKRS
jgi:hypothetical protein